MHSATNPKGMQTPTATVTAGGEKRQDVQKRYRIEAILWVIGLLVFVTSLFLIRAHPAPYSIDLSITYAVQGYRPWPWVDAMFRLPSVLDNPIPSLVAGIFWFSLMAIMGIVFWLRHKSPIVCFQNAAFFGATVLTSAGINVLLDIIVGRPRPDPLKYHIRLDEPKVPFPSYPSGHTEHDVAFYGFLLYLSFTKPVREWRYRWLLLPLQLFAVYDILIIGYSRILVGGHWFTDVLGGYLEGALSLFLFIFLYRWMTGVLARWREKRIEGRAALGK